MISDGLIRTAALAIAVLTAGAAFAQSGSSTIAGIVVDSSGGAIPGAQVRVDNEDTGVTSDTFTNQEGVYNLFNRTNFNIPGYTLGAADFGAISSARAARTMQVGARLQF